jgi:hypothetical protein
MEKNSRGYADGLETRLSPKELFNHLFKELSEVYERYKKYVYTVTATQILILGWFFSSDKGAEFAKSSYFFDRWVWVVLFFLFIEAVVGLYLRYRSKSIGNFIKALNIIEYKYFEFKIINFYMVMIVMIGRLVLYIFMTLVLVSHFKS